MNNIKQRIIDYLLENADPSIALRVKKEIIGKLTKKEEEILLDRIITQKNVQTVVQSQKPDGWIGNHFHGQSGIYNAGMYDNMEVGLRYLAEKGFSPKNGYVSKAVNSFLSKEPFDYSAYREKGPKAPDTDYTYTASGLYLMRSSIIIRAGYESLLPKNSFIDLKHDIHFSHKTFANVLNYKNLDEVIDNHRKKLCFKPNTLWPCLYHLRILAHSKGWRNEKNISILGESVNRLLSFQQSNEMVYTYIKGQFVGPCFAFIGLQMQILNFTNEDSIPLDIMELFARCGIVKNVKLLKNKYKYLLSLIGDDLTINYNIKPQERNWSPYFGFALEEDWKTKTKKQCDLLFRILLIMHYSE
ncbi:MAG: hypothetical protein LBH44_04920 [Treponema sp.]|jgi:hypothetical protein|nr:hypothetical protein [Treponema sp.]